MIPIDKVLCSQILKKKLGDNASFEITDFAVRKSDPNYGYCSSQVHLAITTSHSGCSETFHFFLKLAPDDLASLELLIKPHRLVEKECAAHTRVLPQLLGDSLRFVTARCYLAVDECVAMDDLSLEGYEFPRVKLVDLDHARVAFKLYAKFHAASIAAQHHAPDSVYPKHKDVLFEPIYNEKNAGSGENFFQSNLKRTRYFVERYYQNRSLAERETVLREARRRFIQFKHPSDKYLNVVCHGDAHIKNLIFKYVAHTPTDARMVDFGLINYAPPVADLVYLLHTWTSRQFREENEVALMSLYYETLTRRLKSDHNLDISSILPRERFFESFEEYREYGALINFYICLFRLPKETVERITANCDDRLDYFLRGGINFIKDACDNHADFVKDNKKIVDHVFKLYATNECDE